MGGMIAQEFALQYPKRVRSLILGCTAPGGPHVVKAEPEVNSVINGPRQPESQQKPLRLQSRLSMTPRLRAS